MNFPVARFGAFTIDDESELIFSTGGDLSARYYPWRVEYGFIRPFLGISVNEMKVGMVDNQIGSRQELFINTSAVGGFSYSKNRWQINAELMWILNNRRNFYSNSSNNYSLEIPQAYFSFGIVKYFEGTLNLEEDHKSGRVYEKEKQYRKEGKLNSFSLSFAPSGGYFLHAPSYNDPQRQSLPRHKASMIWEYGAGYLFHDSGIHIGVSYRDYTSSSESFNFEHLIRRRSIAFEVRKFLWDYHGFVPFIGPSISFEKWAVGEFADDTQLGETQRSTMVSPGIVFGWDIISSPLETWVLRTNLRYYPFQKIKDVDGKTIRVDQFEFNFIQIVVYPNRLLNFKN